VATAQLAPIMVGYHQNSVEVGHIALATVLTVPLAVVPVVFANTLFKRFASLDQIPSKVLLATTICVLTALAGYYLLIDKVFFLVYPKEFAPVIGLSYFLAVGTLMQGMGDLFNRFLGAHGQGRRMRNGAFLVGGVNIFGIVVLIWLFGVYGAAWTRVASGVVYCIAMVVAYRMTCRELQEKKAGR
ncbi:hypothetical protein HQ520_13800, partial [bacterium]|nr:hypothetical protein [bacterium]